jgi:DsbC/DsbD-like thiol-disulfide interchange protein
MLYRNIQTGRRLAGAVAAAILLVCQGSLMAAEPATQPAAVTAKLVADVEAAQAGRPFQVGVLFAIQPDWHIYWRNPGDAGLATSVEFSLPKGFRAGPLRWPRPLTFTQPGGIVGYGYNDSVLLYATITPPADWKVGSDVTIKANVGWLGCQTRCVPGEAKLELSVPAAAAKPGDEELFARWAAKTDPVAPAFTLTDQDGKNVSLSDYAGKIVVLEWVNPLCPFVAYHYRDDVRTMPRLAEKYAGKGVVWLAVDTTYNWASEKSKAFRDEHKLTYPILDDRKGVVGMAYQAKSTPDMFVIDPDGLIVYSGAIDNAPLGKLKPDATAVNYVEKALDELQAGKPITTPRTKSYGCSVKYAPQK